jgi:magnesium transporter
MITHYFRTVKDSELKELPTPRSGVWTHVVNPTDEEIAELVGEYVLDEAILEDARDFFEVPRMERSQGATYFFTRYPYNQNQEDVDTAPLLIVMGESFVLTVAVKDVPLFKPFIEGSEVVVTTQKAKLFIQIMSALTTAYERKLVRLRRAVHRDRAKIRQIGNKEIERFVNYEHELSDMTSALIPTNAWLNQVTTGNFMQLYKDDIELMEDLMIANSQLVDSARMVMKTIQNVRGATEAILTNRLNATIQTLTVITILLTIPTVISSVFGMNVPIPAASAPWMFAAILAAIAFFVLVTILILKRNRWF